MATSDLRPAISALIGEFIGTFLVVLVVGCTALAQCPPQWGMTAVGSTFMAMVYALRGVSGGHLNPAVTLAVALVGKFDGVFSGWQVAFCYMGTQVLAGIAAASTYCALFEDKVILSPNEPFVWWQAMIVEVLYTVAVAFVYLNVMCSRCNNPSSRPNQFCGLAMGFTLIAGGHASGAISGGVLNPALALGIEATSSSGGWGFVYVAFQVVGGVVGSLLFRLTRPEERLEDSELVAYLPKLATRLACEFVGTHMIVMTMCLSIAGRSVAIAWGAAAALLGMTYALSDVSGGHFNPAVTLAAVLSRRSSCTPCEGLLYVIFQVGAGTLAGLLYAGLYDPTTFPVSPKDPYPDRAAYILELLFTCMLTFTYLGTVCANSGASTPLRNCHAGLAMGLALFAGLMATLPVSGGILNPAMAVGAAVAHTIHGGHLYYCATFCLVELCGGVLAAVVFHITHVKELTSMKADQPLFAPPEQER